jgi:hypothetical protein
MDPIALAKTSAVTGMNQFLRNFGHVPEDRLHWSPTPTSKTPLQVAAHVALHNFKFAQMIRTRELLKFESLEEFLAAQRAEEAAIATREQMEATFRAGVEEVLRALDTLSPADLDLVLDSGQGWSSTMRALIELPGWHATLHLGQIDYLQTCWGDQEIYVG